MFQPCQWMSIASPLHCTMLYALPKNNEKNKWMQGFEHVGATILDLSPLKYCMYHSVSTL